jgi:hypothetical protein
MRLLVVCSHLSGAAQGADDDALGAACEVAIETRSLNGLERMKQDYKQ